MDELSHSPFPINYILFLAKSALFSINVMTAVQNGNLAYKTGISFTKRESRITNGTLGFLFTSNIDISVGVGYNDITNNLQAHIICIRI